jgi:cytidylate kinase
MHCRVVCLSGLLGAELHDVAQNVADRLGFDLVDEAIVRWAAAEADVQPSVIADVEARRSFVQRALESFGSSADAARFTFGGPAGPLASDKPAGDALRDLIRVAIEETADRGNVVIVLHAAAHALASRGDVLRVLVPASQSTRCARLVAGGDTTEDDAGRELEESDAARADYLKRFYGVKEEQPTQYDLVVNTDRLSSGEAAALVAMAAAR